MQKLKDFAILNETVLSQAKNLIQLKMFSQLIYPQLISLSWTKNMEESRLGIGI